MATEVKSAKRQADRDRTVVMSPLTTNQSGDPPPRPVLSLTQPEVDELDLLCYSLGSGRNACINFATKLLCSFWLHSTVKVRTPRPLKPSKGAPPLTVEYRLNPEVASSLKAVRNKRKELIGASDSDIVKPAVLLLCKKLLPAKAHRLALSFPRGGVS